MFSFSTPINNCAFSHAFQYYQAVEISNEKPVDPIPDSDEDLDTIDLTGQRRNEHSRKISAEMHFQINVRVV